MIGENGDGPIVAGVDIADNSDEALMWAADTAAEALLVAKRDDIHDLHRLPYPKRSARRGMNVSVVTSDRRPASGPENHAIGVQRPG
jgi:hypothetical protein